MSLNNSMSWQTWRAGRPFGVALAAIVMFAAPALGQALEPLPAPAGPVILTVAGSIAVTNGDSGAAFDRDMLYALGISELTTTTPWTDGQRVFSGVLGRAVLARVGAEGTTVLAFALNDYTVEIPMEDFEKYDVLLATEMDGEEMLVSDKGPIWIVYPRDSDPELQDRRMHDRWVWQLKALQVQ
jgi:hypothetical protein